MQIGCLDIVKAVNESVAPNVAHPVGTKDQCRCMTGVPILKIKVKTALNGITQMHHFKFPATHPGRVFVKNTNDGPE